MKNKRTSADILKELKDAEKDFRVFMEDNKHFYITQPGDIGGGFMFGGGRHLRDEYSVWHKALLDRIDNLKTLHGMYIFSEMKESESLSNGESNAKNFKD